MNSYIVLLIIGVCTLVFSGVLGVLVLLGIPLLAGFFIVYLSGVCYMMGMQRRARQCADSNHQYGNRHLDRVHRNSGPQEFHLAGENHSLKL